MKAGVIGSPIAHSLSPVIHRAAYADMGRSMSYDRFEVAPEDLASFIAGLDQSWAGVSVTMPHKQAVMAHLDMIDGLAKVVGAVNTVCVQPTGRSHMLVGFNTDVEGIVQAVRTVRPNVSHAVILGARATASSALAAVHQLGASSITIAARNHGGPGSAYAAAGRMGLSPEMIKLDPQPLLERLRRSDLLISTLPAGVADSLAEAITASGCDLSGLTLLDAVYDPWPSRLVAAVEQAGGTCVPGWMMLLHQGVAQVRLFTGQMPNVEIMEEALRREL